jgi:hypothetical protein
MKRAVALGTFLGLVFLFHVGSTIGILPKPRTSSDPVIILHNAPDQTGVAADALPVTLYVTVKPSSELPYQMLKRRVTPTSYVGSVTVLDETGKKAFGGATVVVEPGMRETVTQKITEGEVTLAVTLSKDKSRATTEVTLSRNGVVVQKQLSDVLLRTRQLPDGIIPLR